MHLILSIIVAVHAYPFVRAFVPHLPRHHAVLLGQKLINTREFALHATAETEAERLLRRARELREAVKAGEEELHTTLLQRKKTRDAATDSIIAQLFPTNAMDDNGGVCALCDRLREKHLALDMLVRVVERLHEREVAARGLEHVEPSIHHDYVTFKRVAQADEVELRYVQGLVDQLVEAAEILDREFINQKSECNGKITHSDIMHWGGGNIAGILKDKAKDLGREHDEQFRKRLESFYDAAKKKHSKADVDKDSWRSKDVWSP
jgi:hypothetical protein